MRHISVAMRTNNIFETNTEHRRNFISDFESYSDPDQVAIYIGLE